MENYYRVPPQFPIYDGQGEIKHNVNSTGYSNMENGQMIDTRQRIGQPQYIENQQSYAIMNHMPIPMNNYDPRAMNYVNNQFQTNQIPQSDLETDNSNQFRGNSASVLPSHGNRADIKPPNAIDVHTYAQSTNEIAENTTNQSAKSTNQDSVKSENLRSEGEKKFAENAKDSKMCDDENDEEEDEEMDSTEELERENDDINSSQSTEESDMEGESLREKISQAQVSGELKDLKTCIRCKAMFTSLTDKGVTICKDDDFTCQSCTESSAEDCTKDMLFTVNYGNKHSSLNLGEKQNKNFNIKLTGLEPSNKGDLFLEITYGKKTEKLDISRNELAKGELLLDFKSQKQIIRPFIPANVLQFPCCDCGDAFLDTQTLADHKLTHPSLKPWVCDECGKEFKYNNILQRHKLSHTDLKEHICPICDKGFRTKANMKRHKQSTHKDVTESDEPEHDIKKEVPSRGENAIIKDDGSITNLPNKAIKSATIEYDDDDEDFDDEEDESMNEDEPEAERYLESIPRRPRHSGMKAAPKKIRFNCKMCEKGFSNKGKWKRHELYHFQMRMPVCEVCGKSFVDKDYLMEHVRTHLDVFTQFICKECGMEFPFKDELQHHILGHASPDENNAGISSDVHLMMASETGSFACPEPDCNKIFRSNYILQRHIVTHNRAHCQCQECGKFYSCRYNLVQHMMIHNTQSNYICDQCGESFKVKQYLSRHMIKHRETKTWACNLCDLKFYRQGNLRHHMKQHVEEKPYQCPQCQKSFVREKTLEEHVLLTHTKERPFQCPVCGRGFGLQRMIKPHMKIHSGFKEHKCDECGKLFTYKSNLNQHMMVHSGEKPFICQYCGKGFARNKYLNDHMRTHVLSVNPPDLPVLPSQDNTAIEEHVPIQDNLSMQDNTVMQ